MLQIIPRFERLEERWLCAASPFPHYDIGAPTLTDIWVDPAAGNDARSGATRAQAVRTLTEAWNRIPSGTTLGATGYRIELLPGRYPESAAPTWWDARHGSFQCPIIVQAADGPGTVTLPAMDVHDVRYMYLIGLRLEAGGGDVLHFASSDHVLVRDTQLVGLGEIAAYDSPQESLKVNQSQYVFVEDSDVSGAWGNAIDFVATQHGHVIGSKVHRSGDWAMLVKGGSAYLRVEGNEFFDAGTGGFTAGQGTGFEFMVSPWLHYEAYDVKFVNNVIHDTEGAGIGVNGGYSILMAHNTMYRVGRIDHVIEVVHGLRGCDGNSAQCRASLAAGGWGTATPGGEERIPDRHVYIYNNIVYNPPGYQSEWQQFAIAGPVTPSAGSNIPNPSRADDDLQIRGNVIWNGPPTLPLGIEDLPLRVTEAQLRADNAINTLQPQLIDPAHGDFRPVPGGNLFSATTYAPPDFSWSDAPARPAVPPGDPDNAVPNDRAGHARGAPAAPGAYAGSTTPASADLAVSIVGPSGPAVVGQRATFTITVTNSGPDAASGVTLTDVLPASFTYISATPSQGSVSRSGGTITASLGTLASGASATIQIAVRPAAVGTFPQNVTVAGSASDPDPADNAASLGTSVAPATRLTFASKVPLSISALGTPAVTSRLAVSGMTRTITDVNVRVNITHSRASDLVVTLIAPGGRRVPLVNRRGGYGRNFTGTVFDDAAATPIGAGRAPFSGSFRPESPLSAMNGSDPNGTWRLVISDRANRNGGTLNNWSLTITTAAAASRSAASASPGSLPAGWASLADAVFGHDFMTWRKRRSA